MSTQDFLAKSAFDNLANSIEQALSDTEGFRDEAENFADLARRGIQLVGVVADLSSFPANPEDGDAVFVESETQIYFWDATSSTWKNSQIIGSAIWGNVQGTLSDQTDLQTALDEKADLDYVDDKASLSLNYGYVSEYTSRVMQEGGTIQNGRRTAAPFISPTYEDSKMILNASGGLDIAEVDGRKVVNKMWDSSQEKENQEFAGSDRPEFHKALDGFEQVCVEKEETNLIEESDFTQSWWSKTNVSVEEEGTIFGYPSYRISELDSGFNQKAIQRLARVFDPEGATIDKWIEIYIKPDNLRYGVLRSSWTESTGRSGGSSFTINIDFQEEIVSSVGADFVFENLGNGVFYLAVRDTSSSTSSNAIRFSFNILNAYNQDDVEYDDFQNRSALIALPGAYQSIEGEGKRYPTLPIWSSGGETTRLAPSPVIENALQTEGSISTVGEHIRSDGENNFFYDDNSNSVSSGENRTFISLNNNQFIVQVFGNVGGRIEESNPFADWENNSKKKVATIVSYNSTNIYFWICDEGGNMHGFSQTNSINNTNTGINLGTDTQGNRATSNRFMLLPSFEAVVVDTAQKAKDYIETLTVGTLNLKASEIVHQNP